MSPPGGFDLLQAMLMMLAGAGKQETLIVPIAANLIAKSICFCVFNTLPAAASVSERAVSRMLNAGILTSLRTC